MITPTTATPITTVNVTNVTKATSRADVERAIEDFEAGWDIRLKTDSPAAQKVQEIEGKIKEYVDELQALRQTRDNNPPESEVDRTAMQFREMLYTRELKTSRDQLSDWKIAHYQEQIDTIDARLAKYKAAPDWLKPELLGEGEHLQRMLAELDGVRAEAVRQQDIFKAELTASRQPAQPAADAPSAKAAPQVGETLWLGTVIDSTSKTAAHIDKWNDVLTKAEQDLKDAQAFLQKTNLNKLELDAKNIAVSNIRISIVQAQAHVFRGTANLMQETIDAIDGRLAEIAKMSEDEKEQYNKPLLDEHRAKAVSNLQYYEMQASGSEAVVKLRSRL